MYWNLNINRTLLYCGFFWNEYLYKRYTSTLATGIKVQNKTDALLPNKRIYFFRNPHRYNGVTMYNKYHGLLSITAAHNWQRLTTLKMVRNHFPMNHTDDPLADGLQPRFTTVHHDLQPTFTVYNLHPRFTTYIHGLQPTSTVYNLDCKTNKAKLSNNSKNATKH